MHGAPGRIQITSILLLLAIAAGGYFAYVLLPPYSDNYTLKQDLSGVANQAWKKAGQRELQKQVIEKAQSIGTHLEIPPSGLPIEVRGLPVGEDEVVVTCTDSSHDCTGGDGEATITVTYLRIIALPYLKGKYVKLNFAPSVKESLQPVEW